MSKNLIRALRAVVLSGGALLGVVGSVSGASAQQAVTDCPTDNGSLKQILSQADAADGTGLNNHFWAVVVNRAGLVCAVAYSGATTGSQWLLSRQIAAAKAFTANGLSLDGAPISTANLYGFVQPSPSGGNPLYGLDAGNVIDSTVVFQGDYNKFGTEQDPMIGYRVGGTITFGGGVALYRGTTVIGGLGLSGDTACADHSVASRTRDMLLMGPTQGNDRMVFGNTAHPRCPNDINTYAAIYPES